MHLGYYLDDESAGYAYNIAAEILHKEYANLNNVDITKVTSPELIKEDVTERLNKYLN